MHLQHPVKIGLRTEAVVIAELARLDIPVLMPFGHNHRYDLVAEVDSTFVRIQCKTGRLRGSGRIVFSTKSVRSNSAGAFCRDYAGGADLFAVFCPETNLVYALEVDRAAAGSAALRVSPTINGQTVGVRWAADHLLADVLRRSSSVGRATNL